MMSFLFLFVHSLGFFELGIVFIVLPGQQFLIMSITVVPVLDSGFIGNPNSAGALENDIESTAYTCIFKNFFSCIAAIKFER